MVKVTAEYVWIASNDTKREPSNVDKYPFVANGIDMRSKLKTVMINSGSQGVSLSDFPLWNYDGSSTDQAKPENSEIMLKPCYFITHPFYTNCYLVLCECYVWSDKMGCIVPHSDNNRRACFQKYEADVEGPSTILHECNDLIEGNAAAWFGLEQEYVLKVRKHDTTDWVAENIEIIGWPAKGKPREQGPYYCGNGANNIDREARSVSEEHYFACRDHGLTISGTNAEVMCGQWEYQIGPVEGGTAHAGDELWLSRFILIRIAEKHNMVVDFSPKPKPKPWNGSGMHANYSTAATRQEGGIDTINEYIEKLCSDDMHHKHMTVYGSGNKMRLVGECETSNYDKCTFGVGNRTTSIRIPRETHLLGRGYLEDRRPAANADPYLVVSMLVKTTLDLHTARRK